MEIQSAFNSGVQGFQKATEDANKAALNIARETATNTQGAEAQAAQSIPSQAVNETTATPTASSQQPSLTQSVIDLKVAELQAKASADVIQTADETLGTLIDVRA